MDVTSVCDPMDFARKVLRGVSAIEAPRNGEADLSLELGLSLWMRQTRFPSVESTPDSMSSIWVRI